ncbi:hypothetical protein [Kaistella sp.]|uniref:hypothetical protein n=1 Tax=Kaistella sp. TaxID=2782235 RepID=UPI002F92A307
MKSKFIKVLANKESLKDKKLYNRLLELYAQVAGVKQVYHYQLGYTPQKLENLKYEIKKNQGISDKEIALYVPGEEDEDEVKATAPTLTPEQIQKAAEAHSAEVAARTKQENPIITELLTNADAQEGLKIRDEYPFLNDPNCPDVFKVLVSDKITAYKEYAKKHAEALEAADQGEAEEKLYELASAAVKDYQMNQDIKKELDHYRDSNGKVLGKHPALADLKLQQEVNEMTEGDLVSQRSNAQKAVNKYKGDKAKAHLHEYHSKKFELITERLQKDFNRTFDKDK